MGEPVGPLEPPTYRCKARFSIEYSEHIEYETDGDPRAWLEHENLEPAFYGIASWALGKIESFTDQADIEVDYHEGRGWVKYEN